MLGGLAVRKWGSWLNLLANVLPFFFCFHIFLLMICSQFFVGFFFGICFVFYGIFFLNCHFFAFFFILLMSNACDILTNIEIFSKNIHFFENCWSIQMFAFFFCLFCFFAFFFVAKILDIFFVFFVLLFFFIYGSQFVCLFFLILPTSPLPYYMCYILTLVWKTVCIRDLKYLA